MSFAPVVGDIVLKPRIALISVKKKDDCVCSMVARLDDIPHNTGGTYPVFDGPVPGIESHLRLFIRGTMPLGHHRDESIRKEDLYLLIALTMARSTGVVPESGWCSAFAITREQGSWLYQRLGPCEGFKYDAQDRLNLQRKPPSEFYASCPVVSMFDAGLNLVVGTWNDYGDKAVNLTMADSVYRWCWWTANFVEMVKRVDTTIDLDDTLVPIIPVPIPIPIPVPNSK